MSIEAEVKRPFFVQIFTDVIEPPIKAVYFVVTEVVKTVAAVIFLDYAVISLFSNVIRSKIAYAFVQATVVSSALVEEFIFRGLFQRSLHLVHYLWNNLVHKGNPSEVTKTIQKCMRVVTAAVAFSLCHWRSNVPKFDNLFQLGWTFLGGVNSGYLSEKYNSLAPAIIAHGLNNLIVQLSLAGRIALPWAYALLVINQVAVFLLNVKDCVWKNIKGRIHPLGCVLKTASMASSLA